MKPRRKGWSTHSAEWRAWTLRLAMAHLKLGHCPTCRTLGDALGHVDRERRKDEP